MTSSLSPVADDLIWFKDSSIGGRRDPLLFAQEWFQQKEERNRALAIKQKEVEEKRWHDEEQAQRLAQHSDGTKPLPTKSGNHVDFHGAAGMYPTPPDGINASAMRGPLSVDATGSTPGDLVRTASYSGDVDMAGNEDHADLEVSRDSEMYDDMEDALFGENGVTEADFSFFDQPDFDGVGGDLNMMGGSDFMEDIETHNQDVAEAGNSHVPGHSASEYEATVESKTVTEHDIQENSEAGAALEQNSARDHRGLPHELDIDRLGPGQQHQKLASPPYSPGQIMKILLPDKDSAPDQSDQGATEYAARRLKSKLLHSNRSAFEQNSFTSIALNRSILSFDEKYSLHGRYGSQAESSVDHRSRRTRPDLSIIPTIGFPKRISRYRQLPNYSTEKSNKHEGHHLQATKNALDTPPDEDSSPESDQDDTSYTTGEDCRRSKRKRPTDDDDISMTSTPYSTGFEAGRPAMTKEDYDELLMDISLHNHDDEDAEIPSESKRYNQNGSMTLTECNFVDIAQIITDQATSRFLPFRMSHDSPLDDHVDSWSLEDIEVTKIPPPHIQVRRADGPLDLLPPAISFWETFGFSPYGGPKDVLAFCVYPPAEGLDEAVKVFAERMSSTYRSCRLGEHRWGSLEHPSEAFAPIGYAWTGLDAPLERSTVIKAMVNECTRIGIEIASLSTTNRNIAVYIVNPFEDDKALGQICAAFYRLYQRAIVELIDRASSTPAQIFLQIIPMSLIASSTAMVIPDHTLMTQVAFEVYERCFVVDNSKFEPLPSSPRGPLFVLGQSPPDSIDYRISSSSATQNENSYIHVAYSSSPDDRWVSAAWIDPEGKAQYSASYCRGKSSSAISRPFSDVAKEIWETTVELIRSKPVRWQILLIKAGSITPKEMEAWTSLDVSSSSLISMMLLSADLSPLLPSQSAFSILTSKMSSQVATYATPVSTPAPSIQSPENSAALTGGTPTSVETPPELDTDAVLSDVADETWSVILSDRGQDEPTAVSRGLLMKRRGIYDTDDVVAMGVSLMFAPKPNQVSLTDVMALYRDLGTLARLKGIVDSVQSVVPWHVAAAFKAQDALSRTL